MADMTQSDYHIHISSQHRWFQLNLKEVWQYRDLIYLFTKRSFVVSFLQADHFGSCLDFPDAPVQQYCTGVCVRRDCGN